MASASTGTWVSPLLHERGRAEERASRSRLDSVAGRVDTRTVPYQAVALVAKSAWPQRDRTRRLTGEVVADKGYDSDETLVGLKEVGIRSQASEPERGQRW